MKIKDPKIGVVSGIIGSTESESKESECSHFDPFSSDSAYDSVAYDPVKTRLLESEAEAEKPTNHNARNRTLRLIHSFASASVSDSLISLHRIALRF